MVLFLTSNVGASKKENGIRVVSQLDNTNNFVNELEKYIKTAKNFLFIASGPQNYEINDIYGQITFNSFNISGFNFEKLQILDYRNKDNAENLVKEANIIFLSGGDPIDEIQFFNELNLSSLLKKYAKIIIGQSAGAINLAYKAYNSPTDEDEIKNIRYYPGLGLTDINIEPHFKNCANFGKNNVIEKILLEDSKQQSFIAIADGSYIIDDGNKQTIYGEAYQFSNGNFKPICKNGEKLSLNKLKNSLIKNNNEINEIF